jgi:hypothetical protein
MKRHRLGIGSCVALLVWVGTAGCGGGGGGDGGPPRTLEELRDARLEVFSGTWELGIDVHVYLRYAGDTEDDCAQLGPEMQVSLNGAPMRVESRGSTSELGPGWPGCFWPRAVLSRHAVPAPDADGVSTFTLSDDTRTLTYRVREPGTALEPRLVEPASGGLVVGGQAVVSWRGQEARLPEDVEFVSLVPANPDSKSVTVTAGQLNVKGDSLGFIVPPLPTGELKLLLMFKQAQEHTCEEGSDACVLRSAAVVLHTHVRP